MSIRFYSVFVASVDQVTCFLKHLYSYHIELTNGFFVCGCFTSMLLSCILGCSSKIGVLTVFESGCKNIYL